MLADLTTTTPDQHIAGTTSAGEEFTISRYGTLVTVAIDGEIMDVECATQDEATAEFAELTTAVCS